MANFTDCKFEGTTVVLDGNEYVGCQFKKCRVVVTRGNFRLENSGFDSCSFEFGGEAAIVVLIFFGLSLVLLCMGLGTLDSQLRGNLIFHLIYIMLGILAALVLLKVFKPSGLSAVSVPESKKVSFSNSQIEP